MISEETRRKVAERAAGRCEYCRCPASHASDDFAVEHILPRALGGSDDFANLAWSCQGCNNRKFTAVSAPDPLTLRRIRLYHPRNSVWGHHFGWSADGLHVIGRTPTGRATVERLKLNRAGVLNLRRALMAVGEHPPADE
ncbi:MAG: HNH endonuclease [Armatimonadetes bacterium]|nr:HNH endonuclease [Armatimonadota bacterium]